MDYWYYVSRRGNGGAKGEQNGAFLDCSEDHASRHYCLFGIDGCLVLTMDALNLDVKCKRCRIGVTSSRRC